eukprot:2606691-Amphidinium_carterae.1
MAAFEQHIRRAFNDVRAEPRPINLLWFFVANAQFAANVGPPAVGRMKLGPYGHQQMIIEHPVRFVTSTSGLAQHIVKNYAAVPPSRHHPNCRCKILLEAWAKNDTHATCLLCGSAAVLLTSSECGLPTITSITCDAAADPWAAPAPSWAWRRMSRNTKQ